MDLVNGTYFQALRLGFGGGEYLDYSFHLSNLAANATWVLTQGKYNQLTGYWIFRPDVKMCWQAVNANGPLDYWNQDGRAKGNPEDWELFVFELVDAAAGVVRVKNIYGRYVRFALGSFVCDTGPDDAGHFYVDFC